MQGSQRNGSKLETPIPSLSDRQATRRSRRARGALAAMGLLCLGLSLSPLVASAGEWPLIERFQLRWIVAWGLVIASLAMIIWLGILAWFDRYSWELPGWQPRQRELGK